MEKVLPFSLDAFLNAPVIHKSDELPETLGIFEEALRGLSSRSGFQIPKLPMTYRILSDDEMNQQNEKCVGYTEEKRTGAETSYHICLKENRRPSLLIVLAHEFGHCLPPDFDSLLLEELKAFVFEEILLRQMEKISPYENEIITTGKIWRKSNQLSFDISSIHKEAQKMMYRGVKSFFSGYNHLRRENVWIQLFNVLTRGKTAGNFHEADIQASPPLAIEELVR